MKILVVAPGPSYSVADVQRGWTLALERQGHDVRTYNLDDRLSFFGAAQFGDDLETLTGEEAVRLSVEPLGAVCYRWWPDVVLVISGFFLPDSIWEVFKHRPQKTILVCTESPYEDNIQFERVCLWQPDLVLLNDPTNVETFKAHHPNTWYVPHAYDPTIHHPGGARAGYECDFAFAGTGYPSRIDFFARCDWRGIDLKLAGNWQTVGGTVLEPFVMHPLEDCIDNADAVDLYRSCKMSANLYRARTGTIEANDPRLSSGWSAGPREIELAACNTFFARDAASAHGEGDDLFPMLPTFSEPRELDEIIRYYLAHESERESAASRAREAIADRTFDAHARQAMQLLPA